MKGWHLSTTLDDPQAVERFASLEHIFALEGQQITRDAVSDLIRVGTNTRAYYVKRYTFGGRRLRRWIGTPRIRSEWENLRRFHQWGLPTAEVVAWGMERNFVLFRRGAMITAEIPGTVSLADLAAQNPAIFRDPKTFDLLSRQIARIARTLHAHRFAHNDLHWRNLLYRQDNGEVFLIDCPTGGFWCGPFLRYRIAKDLASLDKSARKILRRSQRLRFYLHYAGHARLDTADKAAIRRVMHAFEHRRRRKDGP